MIMIMITMMIEMLIMMIEMLIMITFIIILIFSKYYSMLEILDSSSGLFTPCNFLTVVLPLVAAAPEAAHGWQREAAPNGR